MNADEVNKLLIEYVNAGFDCGAFPEEDMLKSDAYQKLNNKSHQLKAKIATLIEQQQNELCAAANREQWRDRKIESQQKEIETHVESIKFLEGQIEQLKKTIPDSFIRAALESKEMEIDKLYTALGMAVGMLRAFRYSMDRAVPFPKLENLNFIIEKADTAAQETKPTKTT